MDYSIPEIGGENLPFQRLRANKANTGADSVFPANNIIEKVEKLCFVIHIERKGAKRTSLILSGIVVCLEQIACYFRLLAVFHPGI